MIRLLPFIGATVLVILALRKYRQELKEQKRLDALALKQLQERTKETETARAPPTTI